ncbi:MAG: hypothetical protein QOD47_2429 [Gemmatimonadaceae bacterium]|nr:hypothetical protein [Gemmatimonadaceae bacterium]
MAFETHCSLPKPAVIRKHRLRSILVSACLAASALQSRIGVAQEPEKKVAAAPAFFDALDPIEVTLTANIEKLRGDKHGDPPWRPATMSYKGLDGSPLIVPLQARTRGIWRLRMCEFPPLRLNFKGETSKGSIFHKLDKPKLVSYCHDNDGYEQYILQEFQLYRIYQLLTPVSHKARLLRLTYADSGSGKVQAQRYGFVLEEPKAIAARLGGKFLEQTGAVASDLDPDQDALLGVFQYMIGNTDFSIAGLHNVELIIKDDGTVMPIAYDFDFAGAVNARYATPDESLHIPNVRRRLFRGYCTDPASYARAFDVFVKKRTEIYALYNDEIGKLLKPGTVKETLQYFDEFYETISDPRSVKRSIIEPCIDRR